MGGAGERDGGLEEVVEGQKEWVAFGIPPEMVVGVLRVDDEVGVVFDGGEDHDVAWGGGGG